MGRKRSARTPADAHGLTEACASMRSGAWAVSSSELTGGFPLERALASLWALNAAANPPQTPTRGCPILPRFVPIVAVDGMVANYDPSAPGFHAKTRRRKDEQAAPESVAECPYRGASP
jgi:hypothetical protein